MAADVYDFQGTNGATIAGTGHTLVGSGTAAYDNTWAVGTSSTSGKFSANAGSTRADRLAVTSPSLTVWIDEIVEIPTLPGIGSGVRYIVMAARSGASATSGAVACTVQVTELGQLALVSTGNIDAFSATGLVAGDKVRISVGLVVATTTTGQVTAKAYTSASNFTTQSGSTFTNSARNFGTAAISWIEVGSGSGATPGVVTRVGLLRVESGRVTEFSAPPSAGATTASVALDTGQSQYPVAGVTVSGTTTAGDTVQLTAAASTGSGTLAYSWSCTSRSPGAPLPQIDNATTSVCIVRIPASDFAATPPVLAGAQYEITCTVTGSGGANAAAIILYAHEAGSNGCGIHSCTPGLWTNVGGAGSYVIALNDRNSATLAESPDSPTSGQPISGVLRPWGLGTPTIHIPSLYSGTATNMTFTLKLEDHSTVVKTETWALGTTETDHTIVLDSTALGILGSGYSTRRALDWAVYGS